MPLARSGSTSPSQFAAVAKEVSAPPPSHVAPASDAGLNAADHATTSSSATAATVSPGSNAADVWLVRNSRCTRSYRPATPFETHGTKSRTSSPSSHTFAHFTQAVPVFERLPPS